MGAEYTHQQRAVYLLKPLTTSLILWLAWQTEEPVAVGYKTAIVVGLAFSLLGDVLLMLPADRFVAGLFSFLLAHLCYVVAFTAAQGFQWAFGWLLPFIIYGSGMLRLLWPRLGPLKLPVIVYMGVILLMGWQATATWFIGKQTHAGLALLGALFFIFSDSVLAWNRFRKPWPSATALVLSSYYLAQLLLAWSIR